MTRRKSAGLSAGLLTISIALLVSVGPARAFSLSRLLGGSDSESVPGLKIIHSGDLAAMIGRHPRNLFIYDANPPDVRAEYGVIPDARLLFSDDSYNVAETLPTDKQATLVFYCYDRH